MKKVILRVLAGAAGTAAAALVLLGIGLMLWLADGDDGSLDYELLENPAMTSFVYDCQGTVTAAVRGSEDRIPVALEDISPYLVDAFLAAEDTRFYSHPGIDLYRIFGSLWANLRSGSRSQGASTITQQLVKLTHLSPEKTYSRKIREALLALKLERHYTKDEILTLYLNRVYFGSGAYGAEAAARTYFGTDAAGLTCAQAALLAGTVKAPGSYAPHLHPDRALERRDLILGLMREQERITQTEYEQALAEPLVLREDPGEGSGCGYYVEAALEEACRVIDMEYGELIAAGLHIHTAMEPWLQQAVDEAMADSSLFPADAGDGTPVEGAAVFLQGSTGLVRALAGGREYRVQRGLDRARDSLRQPGSTVKPLLCYAPAMELEGLSPATPILDEAADFDGYTPAPGSGGYRGWITLRTALSQSANTPAVELLDRVGIPLAKEYASRAGLTFAQEDRGLALALGGFTRGVSPLELAGAYTAFAGEGTASEPAFVLRITDGQGRELYRRESRPQPVFSAQTAFMINDMLRDTVTGGTARALELPGIPLCAKTGTVTYREGEAHGVRDLWTVAYNRDYVGVCWMGFDRTGADRCLPREASGGQWAAPLLARIFSGLYPQGEGPAFSPPPGVVEVSLDRAASARGELLLAAEGTPASGCCTDYFLTGTEPVEYSTQFTGAK